MSVDDAKAALRKRLRGERKRLFAAQPDGGARAIALNAFKVLNQMDLPSTPVVAGYWPQGAEADVRTLMEGFQGADVAVALPVVGAASLPLSFRRWKKGDELMDGAHGTRQPLADKEEITPNVVLVPLLGFDKAGYRLGQGGGYYDRTLQALRSGGRTLAIGIAFAGQQVDALPHDDNDQRLDWVVTETGAGRLGQG